MKTYIVQSHTNYGLMVHVVNAKTPDEAKDLALKHKPLGAWYNPDVNEVGTKSGVVLVIGPD